MFTPPTGPTNRIQSHVIQATKHRKKFQFVPVAGLPTSTDLKLQQIQQSLTQIKQQSSLHAQQDLNTLRIALQNLTTQAQLLGHDLASVQDVQRELLAYEKNYLQHGRAWHQAETSITSMHGVSLVPVTKNPAKGERYYVMETDTGQRIGKVHVGDSRYQVVLTVGTLHPVYQIRNRPERHFVKDVNGNFVRRFVTRGLNDLDAEKLGANQALIPTFKYRTTATAPEYVDTTKAETSTRHPVVRNTNLTDTQQIVSHTRGWYKRFISATTTRRPALSTRGTEFRSLFGAAVVDLAKVPQARIFDLHAPKVAQNLFGHRTRDIVNAPVQPLQATNLAEEQFLAQRDVIRTREVLIREQLPVNALHCQPSAIRVIGFGTNSKADRTTVVSHLNAFTFYGAPSEEVNRPSLGMNCWVYFQFATQGDLDSALDDAFLPTLTVTYRTKVLVHYDPVAGQPGNG